MLLGSNKGVPFSLWLCLPLSSLSSFTPTALIFILFLKGGLPQDICITVPSVSNTLCPDIQMAHSLSSFGLSKVTLSLGPSLISLDTLYHPPCFICLYHSECHPILYSLLISLFAYCLLLLQNVSSLNAKTSPVLFTAVSPLPRRLPSMSSSYP